MPTHKVYLVGTKIIKHHLNSLRLWKYENGGMGWGAGGLRDGGECIFWIENY